jgi:hypothetical protein
MFPYALFVQPFQDKPVILSQMRDKAGAAVLIPILAIGEIAAAVRPQAVQRAVAEQTAEILRGAGLVARKILAVPVAEIGIFLAHPILLSHTAAS